MPDIMVVMGTRPEIMKNLSIIENMTGKVDLALIWSGQHYDPNLYQIFFEQFGLPQPDYDLEVGSDTHSSQTGKIMMGLEEIAVKAKPKIILAEGDTNTVVAVALTAGKLRIPFAHIESGMRSFDASMPEETNRLIADRVAEILFAPTETALLNLLYEGIQPAKVYLSGDTLVDAVLRFEKRLDRKMLDDISIEKGSYGLVTIHRAENTESRDNLKNILEALKGIAEKIPLIFPLHPRTKGFMDSYGYELKHKNIKILPPIGYLEFLSILRESLLVITDSGGVQEEATILKIPCVTARNNTEWPETVQTGGNVLAGASRDRILEKTRFVLEHNEEIRKKLSSRDSPLGDGLAGKRISDMLLNKLDNIGTSKPVFSADFRESGYPKHLLLPGDSFERLSVSQISEKWEVALTLIYDEQGKPVPPYPDTLIRKGWSIRIWGPARHIDSMIHDFKHFM